MAVKSCVRLTGTVWLAGDTTTVTRGMGAAIVIVAVAEMVESAADVATNEMTGGLGTCCGAV